MRAPIRERSFLKLPGVFPSFNAGQGSTLAVRGLLIAALLTLATSACERKGEEEKAKQAAQAPAPEATPEAAPETPAPIPPKLLLTPVASDDLPGWRDDRLAEALPALERSCARLLTQPDERPVGPLPSAEAKEGLAGKVGDWRAVCGAMAALGPDEHAGLRDLLEREFRPFEASDSGAAEGLFTGYYEAELSGALAPRDGYRTPLYGLPSDVVTVDLREFRADLPPARLVGRVVEGQLKPYDSRADIEIQGLDGRAQPILWVSDPVDAFFLHVQGSGKVDLPDGRALRVGFAGSNGRPFYAIGRALIDEGVVSRERASMQAIRDWMRANPARANEIMHRNERFIFFRLIEGEGPIGAQGVPLTPARSLAVDPAFLPLGVPLWLDTTWPASEKPLRRLMVAQDTGSAIKGPVRGDFFWGSGEPALEQAGRMKQTGRYWLLLPKPVAERRARAS